ncbi:MAG: hypothetical protein QJR02_01430 [Sinobacteraceae bacterium]|nr:hypothetical protein [Nevskiaceae bacterium]
MSNITLKKLAAGGSVKKADLYRARPQDIHVEPGFNLRIPGGDLEEHIEGICTSILAGMSVPPIEVRVDDAGKMLIVDGHCRHAAYLRAISRGAEIEFIDVVPFKGNDADRVAKMIASSQGKSLSPLEAALGYKRLIAFGWDAPKIAASTGKNEGYIYALLVLANANSDVQKLVASGRVSASLAIEIIRKQGEKAGEYLIQKFGEGEGAQSRITKRDIAPRLLPRKVMTKVVSGIESFAARFENQIDPVQIESIRALPPEERAGRTIQVDADTMLELLSVVEAVKEAKAKEATDSAPPAAEAAS